MCSVIDKTLFTLKRIDNLITSMLSMVMQDGVAWQLLANKIVVIFYFILYSVIIMTRVKAGVFSQEEFPATSLFKLVFTLVSLSIIKIPSLGNIELVKLFYTV